MEEKSFNIVAKGVLENSCFQARCSSILGRSATRDDLKSWSRDQDEIPHALLPFVRPLLEKDTADMAHHFGVKSAAMAVWNMCADANNTRNR